VTVNYPEAASFEVEVSDPAQVESYQWHLLDQKNKDFTLEGSSAKTNKLLLPSTEQRMPGYKFYCVVTDKSGKEIKSDIALLEFDNVDVDQTLLYVVDYVVKPGESLNLKDKGLGSGTVSFDENGTDVTFDNVQMDNSTVVFDRRVGPARGIKLDRNDTQDKDYKLTLKGENVLYNTFRTDGGDGITLDFMFRGEPQEKPTVLVDGESEGGTLFTKGGACGLRVMGDIILKADLRVEPNGTDYIDGVLADEESHLEIGAGHTIKMKVVGAAFSTCGLTIGENAKIDIDMTSPAMTDPGVDTAKTAIFVGRDKLELKEGSILNVKCTSDPTIADNIASTGAIYIPNEANFVGKGTKINIDMDVYPYTKSFVHEAAGIECTGKFTLEDSQITINESNKGADDSCGMDTGAGNASITNSSIDIHVESKNFVVGLASAGDLDISNSALKIYTKHLNTGGTNYGIHGGGGKMNLDVSKAGNSIEVKADNPAGLAICADTGETGNEKKTYDPTYQPKMIGGEFYIVLPENGAVNIASTRAQTAFDYFETIYDTSDTAKPVTEFAMAYSDKKENKATVAKKTKTIKYSKLKKKNQAFKINAKVKEKAKTTYELTSVSKKAAKKIKVSKSGKVTVKKGLKKGSYKISVNITAKETENYRETTTPVKLTVKVR
jgi:hypothetical protein